MIITAYPGIESAVEGIHHEVDDYIVKPARTDELVALLAEKLAARRAKLAAWQEVKIPQSEPCLAIEPNTTVEKSKSTVN